MLLEELKYVLWQPPSIKEILIILELLLLQLPQPVRTLILLPSNLNIGSDVDALVMFSQQHIRNNSFIVGLHGISFTVLSRSQFLKYWPSDASPMRLFYTLSEVLDHVKRGVMFFLIALFPFHSTLICCTLAEGPSETTSLLPQGRVKACVHSTLPKLHLWDSLSLAGKTPKDFKVCPLATSFDYELYEGDPDHLRTVVAATAPASLYIDPASVKLKHRIGRGCFDFLYICGQNSDFLIVGCHGISFTVLSRSQFLKYWPSDASQMRLIYTLPEVLDHVKRGPWMPNVIDGDYDLFPPQFDNTGNPLGQAPPSRLLHAWSNHVPRCQLGGHRSDFT
ncbi:hypothetical protein CQW23_29680 [Capsicum baccatum]|uniref:Uncharacterized protein n=1 Tax=Capsicum baccatum TaxID=33114 RepID=A0A2G2VCP3_CAPBA|nr:hypothetical protein CQW23_29680 [Capsicum baccatum]